MARIAGVDIPRDKRIEVALTYIFGIGPTVSKRVLDEANVSLDTRVHELTEAEVARIRQVIDVRCNVEGDLRKEVAMSIKRLMDLNAYRGIRHRRHLPVRGQRTHTNARTRKGPRRVASAKKR